MYMYFFGSIRDGNRIFWEPVLENQEIRRGRYNFVVVHVVCTYNALFPISGLEAFTMKQFQPLVVTFSFS